MCSGASSGGSGEARAGAAGFQVVATADGAAAVAVFGEALRSGRPFPAVVFDLTVPGGMGGVAAAAAIRALEPAARIVLASGYAGRARSADGFAAVLAKPFPLRQLADTLARVAGRPGETAALTPPAPHR